MAQSPPRTVQLQGGIIRGPSRTVQLQRGIIRVPSRTVQSNSIERLLIGTHHLRVFFSTDRTFLELEAGTVGLALSYAVTLMGMFQWGIRQSTEVENLVRFPQKSRRYAPCTYTVHEMFTKFVDLLYCLPHKGTLGNNRWKDTFDQLSKL